MSSLPLDNVRVLDLAHVWAGPTVGRIMADLGADVVKIERAATPDNTRNAWVADNDYSDAFWNRGLYFQKANASKRAITLDLAGQVGAVIFAKLIAVSDVLVENFTPRVMKSLGFDYESVSKINPDIIMISISGFGQTGPHANYGAFGMVLEPAAGISQLSGYPDGAPYKNGNTFVDPYGGILGAGAVLAALHYRRRSGRGQYIDLSLQEAAIPIAGVGLLDYQLNHRPWRRIGNRSRIAAPQGVYRCAGRDDWIYLSIRSDDEWRAFCGSIGCYTWLRNERFSTALARHRNQDELDTLVTSWTEQQDKVEAMQRLQDAGILAAAVLNPKEVLQDPQLIARQFFTSVEIPKAGPRPLQKYVPAKFSRFDARARGAAPHLGQHNTAVLHGLLGLSDEELRSLAEQGIIGTAPTLALPREDFAKAMRQPVERYLEQGSLLAIDTEYREALRVTLGDRPAEATTGSA